MSMIKAAIAVLSGGMCAEAKVEAALEILNSASTRGKQEGGPKRDVSAHVLAKLRKLGALTASQVHKSNRSFSTHDVTIELEKLAAAGEVSKVTETHPVNGLEIVKYVATNRSD